MLIIDENLLKIDFLIDEMVSKISELEVTERYREAKKDFEQDEELQKKLRQLNENIDFIDFRPELRELQKNLNLNSKIYRLRLAENDLQELLSDIAKLIAASISADIDIDENSPLQRGKVCKHGR